MPLIAPRLARRDLFAALATLGIAPGLALAAPANTFWDGPAPPGAVRIGQAWLAEHPGIDAAALTKRLAPDGWSPATLEKLRLRIAADFRQGRVFRYRGWRLAETEGALLALTVPT